MRSKKPLPSITKSKALKISKYFSKASIGQVQLKLFTAFIIKNIFLKIVFVYFLQQKLSFDVSIPNAGVTSELGKAAPGIYKIIAQ